MRDIATVLSVYVVTRARKTQMANTWENSKFANPSPENVVRLRQPKKPRCAYGYFPVFGSCTRAHDNESEAFGLAKSNNGLRYIRYVRTVSRCPYNTDNTRACLSLLLLLPAPPRSSTTLHGGGADLARAARVSV